MIWSECNRIPYKEVNAWVHGINLGPCFVDFGSEFVYFLFVLYLALIEFNYVWFLFLCLNVIFVKVKRAKGMYVVLYKLIFKMMFGYFLDRRVSSKVKNQVSWKSIVIYREIHVIWNCGNGIGVIKR